MINAHPSTDADARTIMCLNQRPFVAEDCECRCEQHQYKLQLIVRKPHGFN